MHWGFWLFRKYIHVVEAIFKLQGVYKVPYSSPRGGEIIKSVGEEYQVWKSGIDVCMYFIQCTIYGHNRLSENDHLGYSVYNSYTIFRISLCWKRTKFCEIQSLKRKKKFLMAVTLRLLMVRPLKKRKKCSFPKPPLPWPYWWMITQIPHRCVIGILK